MSYGLRFVSYELRVVSYESMSTSHEFRYAAEVAIDIAVDVSS